MVCSGERRKACGKPDTAVDSGGRVCSPATEFSKEEAWNQMRNFLNVSGGRMGHNDEKKVCCEFEVQRSPMRVKLRASDARNSLASVASVRSGRERHQEGVGFQRAGSSGPQRIPPASVAHVKGIGQHSVPPSFMKIRGVNSCLE